MPAIVAPLPQFFDLNGLPLQNGSVYIGAANQNPETSPVSVFWDSSYTQPAQQPLRVVNGMVSRSGTVAQVYVSGDYSMTVKNAAGAQVFYARTSEEYSTGQQVAGLGSTDAGKGDALIAVKRTATGSIATTQHAVNEQSPFYAKADFGATLDGVADDYTAIQAALTAANGTGRSVVIDGPACKIGTTLSQSNHAHYNVEWGQCQVSYTGGAGTYLLDMTQAGRIKHLGGIFTGDTDNHLVKTAGSTAAQATTYPTIPSESLWTRQVELHPVLVTGFATAFDFGNFTREVKYSGVITGNVTAVKMTGKVVNADFMSGELYSGLASSQAVLVRGDSGDATYRYAEGLSFNANIMDSVGTTVDIRDAYAVQISAKQIKAAAAGIAVDITKGVCPITRDIAVTCPLVQGKLRIGTGLSASHLFSFKGIGLGFSDTDGTAINIEAYSKGVSVNGASFNSPTGTARMFAVGADCTQIKLDGLMPDAGTYTNAPTIASTSVAGVEAEFSGSWTPAVAFGGAATGVTYSTQSGRYYYRGGMVQGFGQVTLTSKGSATGAATITGLPFACGLLNGAAWVSKYSGMNSAFTPILDIAVTTSAINVKTGAAGSDSAFSDADFSNASVVNFSFSYPVS